MILKTVTKAIILASSLFAVQAAHAALVNCPASFTANGTAKVEDDTSTFNAASACQYLNTPSNQPATIDNINDAMFFGFDDWEENGLNEINLQVDANASSGTWAIIGANFAVYDYMIVFKDGSDTNLVGFLLDGPYTSGDWLTPFTSEAFTFTSNGNGQPAPTQKEVSHYSIVQREGEGEGESTEIPEPGMVALLGIGMLGYAAARRRSLKK